MFEDNSWKISQLERRLKQLQESSNDIRFNDFKSNKYKCVLVKAGLTVSECIPGMYKGKLEYCKALLYKGVLKEAADNGLFENEPAVFRYGDDHMYNQNFIPENIVGIFTKTKWNEKGNCVEGILNLDPEAVRADEFKNYLNSLLLKYSAVDLSIVWSGEVNIGEIPSGEIVADITKLNKIASIDAVPHGNAGGKILGAVESNIFNS